MAEYNRSVPRNAEVIRQWTILREIERARGAGVTIDDLSSLCSVTTRTIRRDLQALEEAGFPLYDDKSRDDLAFDVRGSRLEPHDVILDEPQLGGVLDGDDPLVLRDEPRQDVQQRRLP